MAAVQPGGHPSSHTGAIAGYRAFVAIVSVNYFTLIALSPRAGWDATPVPLWQLVTLSVLYLALGIWGFEFAQRVRRVPVSLAYLLVEFFIGMRINTIAPDGDQSRAGAAERRADGRAQSVKALREDTRADGIAEQLAALVDASRDETLRATFASAGDARPIGAAVALALHRTALEALTNVRRHEAASRVTLVLTYRDEGRVHLRVEDDGRGAERLTGGFGLVGIRERAEQLGGTVHYRSAPGQGFTLDVELPAS